MNPPESRSCAKCGSPLRGDSPGAGPPPSGSIPAHDFEGPRRRERTKTGLLLLLVGALVAWVPVVGVLGLLLLAVGSIYMILGRRAFGHPHARFVAMAVTAFLAGIAAALVGGAFVSADARLTIPALTTEDEIAEILRSIYVNALLVAFASEVVYGLSLFLFPYRLQDLRGRVLLLAALAASVVLHSILVVLLLGDLSALADASAADIVLNRADETSIARALTALTDRVEALGLLSVAPALLFAAADYLAWSRIERGGIPTTTEAPPDGRAA